MTRQIKKPASKICFSTLLYSFDEKYFGFFYKAIIGQHETIRDGPLQFEDYNAVSFLFLQ